MGFIFKWRAPVLMGGGRLKKIKGWVVVPPPMQPPTMGNPALEQRSKVRYLQSLYLDHSTHTNLLEHFNKSIETLDPSKMIKVSMDGPIINLKFFKELTNERSDSGIPALIDFGSCSLHIVNSAF